MAEAYILDTHALFWYLTARAELGATAREVIAGRAAPDVQVIVSAISIAEMYYLNEKLGRPLDFESEVQRLASDAFELVDFEAEDVLVFDQLQEVSEMHDRIIAALALRRGAAVLTRDQQLAGCASLRTVW